MTFFAFSGIGAKWLEAPHDCVVKKDAPGGSGWGGVKIPDPPLGTSFFPFKRAETIFLKVLPYSAKNK
jgi:hypothetical protein